MGPAFFQSGTHSRNGILLTLALLSGVAVLIYGLRTRPLSPTPPPAPPWMTSSNTIPPTPALLPTLRPTTTPPGDATLAHYGDSQSTIEKDLTLVSHTLNGYQILAKSSAPLPLGSNAEITRALTGGNRIGMIFVSTNHPYISSQGEFLDRWKTPLFFHALASDRIEIRSAGPDRTLGTQDDITRGASGIIRHGVP